MNTILIIVALIGLILLATGLWQSVQWVHKLEREGYAKHMSAREQFSTVFLYAGLWLAPGTAVIVAYAHIASRMGQ